MPQKKSQTVTLKIRRKLLNHKLQQAVSGLHWGVRDVNSVQKLDKISSGPQDVGELAGRGYLDSSPNPICAIFTISRPIGSEAVAAGDTTFQTCSMFCEQTN